MIKFVAPPIEKRCVMVCLDAANIVLYIVPVLYFSEDDLVSIVLVEKDLLTLSRLNIVLFYLWRAIRTVG
jgi:hypothetical protein